MRKKDIGYIGQQDAQTETDDRLDIEFQESRTDIAVHMPVSDPEITAHQIERDQSAEQDDDQINTEIKKMILHDRRIRQLHIGIERIRNDQHKERIQDQKQSNGTELSLDVLLTDSAFLPAHT